VTTIANGRQRVELRADDPSLTPVAGLVLAAEACRVLDVLGVVDRRVGPIKQRARGVGAGGLLVGLAESMLAGGDFFADCDTLRADAASRPLRTVPGLAARTALGLAHLNHPGFDGGSVHWIPTPVGSACWAA
jgi:hypothetical protein